MSIQTTGTEAETSNLECVSSWSIDLVLHASPRREWRVESITLYDMTTDDTNLFQREDHRREFGSYVRQLPELRNLTIYIPHADKLSVLLVDELREEFRGLAKKVVLAGPERKVILSEDPKSDMEWSATRGWVAETKGSTSGAKTEGNTQ